MLPNDPIMLMSYLNTQLRDNYPNLDELCASYCVEKGEIVEELKRVGIFFDEKLNKFVQR